MGSLLDKLAGELGGRCRVLDIGSRDINGSYRPLIEERGWAYVGFDMEKGPNVDRVGHFYDRATYDSAFSAVHTRGEDWRETDWFDLVISGQQLEHDHAPWLTVQNAVAFTHCRWMVLVAPFSFPIHHEPDYWRFTPAGLRRLLERAGLTVHSSGSSADDSWAIGRAEPKE